MDVGLGNGHLDFPTESFSYSLWVRVVTSAGPYDAPWWKGGASSVSAGYCFELGTGIWQAHVSDGTIMLGASLGTESQWLGAWVHLAAVVDQAAEQMWAANNGQPSPTTSIASLGPVASQSASGRIGRPSAGQFRGRIDEVRIYREALTPDWVRTEAANVRKSDFIVVGTEELAP